MPRTVLARNLASLMEARQPEPWKNRELARQAHLDHKTVGRILDGSHAATIDTIAALAEVFGLLPWQMLVPDLQPHDPPVTQLCRTEAQLYARIKSAAVEFGRTQAPE